jgi:hypothetical protein
MSEAEATATIRGIGSLLRRGYLKARGEGYVTTKKTYAPEIAEA